MINKNHLLNGVSPSINGHVPATNGHEVTYDPAQINLPWEDLLPSYEPTAKTESPEAESNANAFAKHVTKARAGSADLKAVKKQKAPSASSISNTLTHCDQFIASATAYGPNYASSNVLYGLPNLISVRNTGYLMVEDVSKAEIKQKYSVAFRMGEFDALEALLTRIIAELILSGASEATVSQARGIIRKLRGARAVAKDLNDPTAVYHSVSQTNYDDVVTNFYRLILMVAEEPDYDPIVDDLKVLALETKLEVLRTANSNLYVTKAALDAARIARNTLFDTKVTGLVDVFLVAKKVVVANFGSRSEQYKKIKSLSFRRIA